MAYRDSKPSGATFPLLIGILFVLSLATHSLAQEVTAIEIEKTTADQIKLLGASDISTRTWALNALSARAPEELRKHAGPLLPALALLSNENTTQSIQAVVLIGKMGNKSKAKDLKALLKKTRGIQEPDAGGLSAKQKGEKQKACLTALLLLRDSETEDFIRAALAAEDIEGRILAAQCLGRSEREDFLEDLVALLDDEREALVVGPPEAPLQIKVRDLAADAIVGISKIPPSIFRSKRNLGEYTDDEIKTLRDLIVETMKPKRPTVADAPPEPLDPRPAESSAAAPTVEEIVPIPKPEILPSTTAPVPPVGLSDAHGLLAGALTLLEYSKTTQTFALHRQEVFFRIEQVEKYLDHLSANMAGEIIYDWHALSKEWVAPSPRISIRFAPDEVVSKVMAICIYAKSWGSVYLSEMKIVDASGNVHSYSSGTWGAREEPGTGEVLIEAKVPRREVFFLDEATNVLAVDLVMHHDGERKRRIYVELGVPSSPEYAREIARLCLKARHALKNGEFPLAQAHLRLAQERLQIFQDQLSSGKTKD